MGNFYNGEDDGVMYVMRTKASRRPVCVAARQSGLGPDKS